MKEFIAEVWRFLLGSPHHPIYRHELAGWSHLRLWRGLRRGCLPGMIALLVGTAGCCGLITLASLSESDSEWSFAALAALFGMLIGGEIVRWLVGLLATAVTATSISAEVEADTYALLRITPLSAREIVLAKFGAAVHQFRLPVLAIALIRALFVLGTVAFFAALMAGSALEEPLRLLLPSVAASVPLQTSYILAGVTALLAALFLLIYFLANPALLTLLYAAVGMLASSWARTRSGGLMAAIGLRVALWTAAYILSQAFTFSFSLLSIPLSTLPTAPVWLERLAALEPSLMVMLVAFGIVLWLVLVVATQMGLTLLFLYLAVRRAERLPYEGKVGLLASTSN